MHRRIKPKSSVICSTIPNPSKAPLKFVRLLSKQDQVAWGLLAIFASFFKIHHICLIKKHFPQFICSDPVMCICSNSFQLQQLHVDKRVHACRNITCKTHKILQVQSVSRGTRMLTPASACKVPTVFFLLGEHENVLIFRRHLHLQKP